jgi:hypothetical protein
MTHNEHILFIDSRFSDSISNVDFSVIFNKSTTANTHFGGYPTQVFKNVTSVELTALSMNAYPTLTDENYVVLDIDELNNRMHSNVPEVNQSFAVVYTDKAENQKSYQKSYKGHDFDIKKVSFDPPMSSLSRLTIKLKNPMTREVIEDHGKTTFIFKITTLHVVK